MKHKKVKVTIKAINTLNAAVKIIQLSNINEEITQDKWQIDFEKKNRTVSG